MERLRGVAAILLGVLLLTGCGTALPDVNGMPVEAATQAVEAAGFEVGPLAYDEQSSVAAGSVIAQKPEAGQRADEGSVVVLTVAGSPPVETPNLSGLDEDAAGAAIKAVGLTVGEISQSYDSSVAAGMLMSQEPSAGLVIGKGSTVALVFSKGPAPVDVPRVKGKSSGTGSKTLEAAGFKVKVSKKYDGAKKGTIIAQRPSKGRALPGSTVVITVSKGPQLVRVPDIEGMIDPDPLLRSKGLRPKSIPIHGPIESDAAKFGEAYRQSPKAGSLVPEGSTVTYHFWWERG